MPVAFLTAEQCRRYGRFGGEPMSAQLGLSRPALIAYEKGARTPGPTILYRLATALGVDVLKLTSVTLNTATLTDLRARAGFTKDRAGQRTRPAPAHV